MTDFALRSLASLEQAALAARRASIPQRGREAVSVLDDPDSCLAQLNALIAEMPARRCLHLRKRPNQHWWTSLSLPTALCARCRSRNPIWDPRRHPFGNCDCCGARTQFTADRSSPDNLGTGALWRCLDCGDAGFEARRVSR